MIRLLALVESIRSRLNDEGGYRGAPDAGYYRRWQHDDSTCLWKNREIVGYIRSGLLEIASRAPWECEGATDDLIGDDTRLAVVAGFPEVETGPHTAEIEQARLLSSGRLLSKTETGRLASSHGEAWAEQMGEPTHYVEVRSDLVRLFPIPLHDDELRLIVRRRTWHEFDWDDVAKERSPYFPLCDVPVTLEQPLIEAACHYAYHKRDADAQSPARAAECWAKLAELVGPPVTWRHQEARRYNANLTTAIRPPTRSNPIWRNRYHGLEWCD